MDQELKQRIVGATVITALAAIFVPMLFDDPVDQTGKKINQLTIPEVPAQLQRENSVILPENVEDVISLPVLEPLKTVDADPEETIETDLEKTDEIDAEKPAKLSQWFIQAGVFSQKENAVAFRDKLRKQGFSASVSAIKGEKNTLYRVKVGPEMNQERAEQIKVKLEKLNDIKTLVTIDKG